MGMQVPGGRGGVREEGVEGGGEAEAELNGRQKGEESKGGREEEGEGKGGRSRPGTIVARQVGSGVLRRRKLVSGAPGNRLRGYAPATMESEVYHFAYLAVHSRATRIASCSFSFQCAATSFARGSSCHPNRPVSV